MTKDAAPTTLRLVHRACAVLLPLLSLAVQACDAGDTRFALQTAADFSPARHTVSVFGVYRDGRMSTAGWDAMAAYVTPALGAPRCDVGYEMLATKDGILAEAFDERAREEGPTDDLLTQIAPAAAGEEMLVLTFAGKLPEPKDQKRVTSPPPETRPPGGRQRQMSQLTGGHEVKGIPQFRNDMNGVDVAASLYSVAQKRSVALLEMHYSGTNLAAALASFGAKLGKAFPAMVCAGWNWDAKIDPKQIRHAGDEEPGGGP